jgi:hypothetical protein
MRRQPRIFFRAVAHMGGLNTKDLVRMSQSLEEPETRLRDAQDSGRSARASKRSFNPRLHVSKVHQCGGDFYMPGRQQKARQPQSGDQPSGRVQSPIRFYLGQTNFIASTSRASAEARLRHAGAGVIGNVKGKKRGYEFWKPGRVFRYGSQCAWRVWQAVALTREVPGTERRFHHRVRRGAFRVRAV